MTNRSDALLRQYRHGKARRQALAERLYGASQYTLMRTKFKKHRVAMVSLWLLGILYLVAIFADFVAPYAPEQRFKDAIYESPTALHIMDWSGNLTWPFFYTARSKVDLLTFRYESKIVPDSPPNRIELFPASAPYKLLGIFTLNRHLFGAQGEEPVFLLGADNLGRDLFSRIIHASRISLFVGFGGVFISFILGLLLGGISGFIGGSVDVAIQRFIELVMSIPQIPLWMALARALPQTGRRSRNISASRRLVARRLDRLARVIRGRILSLREEDYVTAAKISSAARLDHRSPSPAGLHELFDRASHDRHSVHDSGRDHAELSRPRHPARRR